MVDGDSVTKDGNRTIVRVSDCGWLSASATLLARAVSDDNL